jgi:CDP-diacylglycerol--glycerol-3-phosphate 3-phosphatidyltransferase
MDRLIKRLFLWALPLRISPNHLTLVRFLLLPPLVALLLTERRGWALVVFVVAATTDFLDGAAARTRDQVTTLGIVIDPLADKLLIGITLALLGWEYLVIKIAIIALAVELVGMLAGVAFLAKKAGAHLPAANVFGKVKMALQSVGGGLFLLGSFLSLDGVVEVALGFLWAALLFAALSVVLLLARRRRLNEGR